MVLNWLKNTSKVLWLPFFADSVLWNESLDLDLKLTIINSLLYFSPNTYKVSNGNKRLIQKSWQCQKKYVVFVLKYFKYGTIPCRRNKIQGFICKVAPFQHSLPYIRKNYPLIMRHYYKNTKKTQKLNHWQKAYFCKINVLVVRMYLISQ